MPRSESSSMRKNGLTFGSTNHHGKGGNKEKEMRFDCHVMPRNMFTKVLEEKSYTQTQSRPRFVITVHSRNRYILRTDWKSVHDVQNMSTPGLKRTTKKYSKHARIKY